MINHLYSLLCANVIIDKMTNLVSYISVISDGVTDRLPKEMPPLWLSSCWLCAKAETINFTIRVNLVAPSDKTDLIKELEVSAPKQNSSNFRRHMVNLHINKFLVAEEGLHFFDITYKVKGNKTWKKATQIPFNVQMQPLQN